MGKHAATAVAVTLAVALSGAAARSAVATRLGDAAAAQRPERLRYHATWNAVPVANAELLVQPDASAGTVTLRGRADTNEVLDFLWRMRDSFEATVAVAPVAPVRFALHQNENGRRRDTTIVATPPRLVAVVERRGRRRRRADVALAPPLHDPASVGYLIRTLPPELDARASYEVLAGTKVYDLTVAASGSELVEAAGRLWPARRFHLALQLEPRDVESRDAGDGAARGRDDERDADQPWRALKVQEADLWISSGPERLPLRLRSRTFWGWVTVELVGRIAPPSA